MTARHPEKVNNPINPIKKKPSWIRTRILDSQNYFKTKEIINRKKLHTVCQEASCPNISECWSKKHATFMIMGDTCTRACAFCNVKTGKPTHLDPLEPMKIAQATKELELKHVVITSVDRDDLKDGGAEHFSKIILETRKMNNRTTIEVLTPDFFRKGNSYQKVVNANPDVFNHNIETVPSLYLKVRPGSRYFPACSRAVNFCGMPPRPTPAQARCSLAALRADQSVPEYDWRNGKSKAPIIKIIYFNFELDHHHRMVQPRLKIYCPQSLDHEHGPSTPCPSGWAATSG